MRQRKGVFFHNGASALRTAYSGSAPAGLCRRAAPIAVVLAALATAGCSTSFPLGALGGKDEIVTGSVPRAQPASFNAVSEDDLAFAKAAASGLLARGARDMSASWENPRSGAHGTVTPIAAENGAPCREFLVSYVQGERETWYQGSACRSGHAWDVRELKLLQRT
jgi:hypothetical protein